MFRFKGFSPRANDAINLALSQACLLGHTYIGSEHLLLGLLLEGGGPSAALTQKGVTPDQVLDLLIKTVGRGIQSRLSPTDMTPRCRHILEQSLLESKKDSGRLTEPEHILLAMLREKECYALRFLMELGVEPLLFYQEYSDTVRGFSREGTPGQAAARKNTPRPILLEKFGRDLTEKARCRQLDPVIGREKEIDRVVRILSRRSKNNPCLIGEAGVGKTAIAEGLAQRIAQGRVPKSLQGKRLIALDLVSMVAGTKYRGEFEERVKNMMDEAAAAQDIILFIDEIHNIIGAGAAGTQAPGESFPERTIAGIGKDMASRINLLNGQADAARTGVESKMSTYIALYAADDDSLTASVEDYRYYLDELASLTQLAAVAATDAEYRRCLEQLLRSFLTIKRAIDTDASDIHDQLDRINAMLKGQQFGPKHGSLSLHADVRRPERTFWAQLIRVIGTLNDWKSADVNDSDASRKAFAACAPMVGLLRAELAQVKDANGVKSYGARNLDPRCRSSFYAIVHHADGPDERITSTGGRSGGALQELTSFVYGAALIYLLGGGLTSEPSYTTLFLDEALIKADGRYTQRALTVLPRLGFQVIVSAPESKTGEILEVSTKAYVTYKDPDTGLTSLREAVLHQNDMDDESSSDILKDDGVAE